MKLENSYEMNFEIDKFDKSIIAKAKIIYEVYKNDFNLFLPIIKIENIQSDNFSIIKKIDIEKIIKKNIEYIINNIGSFYFDNKIVYIIFDENKIDLLIDIKDKKLNIDNYLNDFILELKVK